MKRVDILQDGVKGEILVHMWRGEEKCGGELEKWKEGRAWRGQICMYKLVTQLAGNDKISRERNKRTKS